MGSSMRQGCPRTGSMALMVSKPSHLRWICSGCVMCSRLRVMMTGKEQWNIEAAMRIQIKISAKVRRPPSVVPEFSLSMYMLASTAEQQGDEADQRRAETVCENQPGVLIALAFDRRPLGLRRIVIHAHLCADGKLGDVAACEFLTRVQAARELERAPVTAPRHLVAEFDMGQQIVVRRRGCRCLDHAFGGRPLPELAGLHHVAPAPDGHREPGQREEREDLNVRVQRRSPVRAFSLVDVHCRDED